jgi:molybdenum cofactor cytidylyltransferase
MFTCILLAAGESQRFGSPKALAEFNETNIIRYVQDLLLSTSLDEIILVLGAHADIIKPFILQHKKIKVVYNKYYNLGQTSSFQTGVNNADISTECFLLLPVDVPFIRSETIDLLLNKFSEQRPKILVPVYKGKKGHPPVFDSSLKKEILELPANQGINTIIHKHQNTDETLIDVPDEGVIRTFNTVEEWQNLKTQIMKR